MSSFVPNTHQTPNLYIDRYMAFLTCEEWKVLSYATRRIMGFADKQCDRIAQQQFSTGLRSKKDNSALDYGTGLSRQAISKALDALVYFGLLVEVEPANRGLRLAAVYALQLDENLIDGVGLVKRSEQRHKRTQRQTKTARKTKGKKRELYT